MISAGDVAALLRAGPDAVLVVVGGRASVVQPAQLDDNAFRLAAGPGREIGCRGA